MVFGESACPGSSENVWERGVEGVFYDELRAAEVYRIFEEKQMYLRCLKKAYLPKSSLSLPMQITSSHRLGGEVICVVSLNFEFCEVCFFWTHLIFANESHSVARKTKDGFWFSLSLAKTHAYKNFDHLLMAQILPTSATLPLAGFCTCLIVSNVSKSFAFE